MLATVTGIMRRAISGGDLPRVVYLTFWRLIDRLLYNQLMRIHILKFARITAYGRAKPRGGVCAAAVADATLPFVAFKVHNELVQSNDQHRQIT